MRSSRAWIAIGLLVGLLMVVPASKAIVFFGGMFLVWRVSRTLPWSEWPTFVASLTAVGACICPLAGACLGFLRNAKGALRLFIIGSLFQLIFFLTVLVLLKRSSPGSLAMRPILYNFALVLALSLATLELRRRNS